MTLWTSNSIIAGKYQIKTIWPQLEKKKEFEKRGLFLKSLTWRADGKQCKKYETVVKDNNRHEKYTINNGLYDKVEISF